jgi:predicted nuclease of predicted toxin-antitoxin system
VRLKLDENLPAALAERLSLLGHDADTVPQEDLAGEVDAEIWNVSQAAGRFLITQDLDFSDIRSFAPGTHQGILLVRLADPSRRRLIDRVEEIFRDENVESWRGCFVVMTDRKIRIRRP